jgi:hypothetical protein
MPIGTRAAWFDDSSISPSPLAATRMSGWSAMRLASAFPSSRT